MSQRIRIKLKSYDHNLVDKSAEKIVKTVKMTGAVVNGPIPLPTNKKIFTVNRSTFVNKKSREQFELSSYKRLMDIYSTSAKTIDALMKLEVLTPDAYLGDVTGDLNRRRGVLENVLAKVGVQAIQAKVPLQQMFGYVTALRTITSGRANSTMEFSHYAELPKDLSENILKK